MPDAAILVAPPPAPPPGVGPEPFARALRRALREGAGRVVLRVEEHAPHRRRVARALLQEGALAAGGQVLEGPGGDLLLVGAEARRAERLRMLLERLVGPAGTLIWSLERDAAALLAYAAGGPAEAPRPMPAGPTLGGLDAFLDTLPLAGVVARRQGLRLGPAGPQPAFLRLEPARAGIATRLGALGTDADLVEHAMRRIADRLLGALADPKEARALLGAGRPARLHLPLPPGRGAGGAVPPGMLVATLPLAEAPEPEALAARQAALAEAGIAMELDGLDATALALLEPAALPGDLLRLHWSPPLDHPAALRGLDPARLVLAGAPSPEAAARLGISLVEAA
jgi:hypothetical protein